MAKRALLMVKVDAPNSREKEWNDWYNNKHVADRLKIPGFIAARRFTVIPGIPKQYAVLGEAKYLALYDLESARVLKDKPYREQQAVDAKNAGKGFEGSISKLPKFARGVYEQIYPEKAAKYTVPPTKFVFVVGHDVPRGKDKEYNAWYDTEHLPALMRLPGWVTGRRFILAEPPLTERGGTLSKYLTVYDIEEKSALQGEAFRKAGESPWSDWVRSWYTRVMCALYQRIYPKG